MQPSYFIGVDIGTQGARVVLVNQNGIMVGSKEESFPLNNQSREEQSPELWWSSCLTSLRALCYELKPVIDLSHVRAIAVTSTSGTIIPLDKSNRPLHAAIMYSDPRSVQEARLCKAAASTSGSMGFTAFNASCGLSKMVWFVNNFPEKASQLGMFIHAADYITGQLSGNFKVTDYTNALKSGYDIVQLQWPDFITKALPIKPEWLQEVVPTGVSVGCLKSELAEQLGLSDKIIITAGVTDGCASQVASGAVKPGDWNTTIGTTLVIKGVTAKEVKDPTGVLYCHRHPEGYWMPGGASNTGADWVSRLFGQSDLNEINAAAAKLIPTGLLAWPLLQQGERFPFVAPDAQGFAPEELSEAELFTAYMEGVAYIERYAYERIQMLSGETIHQVYTAGGASNSDAWLTIRSNVLGVPVYKMQSVSGAAGAAILAASKTYYTSLSEAAGNMVQVQKIETPDKDLVDQYDQTYTQFINTLKLKGYIPE
ncbi:carbohydrate kinase [Flavisolibacter tropicus]|uniref:Carbohydrate kinase n=2 Tax=Flavisolibacter tropicus TaxID=1492898 RepID=A0A172U3A7_9BACT|nr:carbohydrate kinase [Flavisolibacter tropicus]